MFISVPSILTVLESVSEDFDKKSGIRGSEFIIIHSGWGLRDEGLDLFDTLKGKRQERGLLSFIVDFDPISVCFRRF